MMTTLYDDNYRPNYDSIYSNLMKIDDLVRLCLYNGWRRYFRTAMLKHEHRSIITSGERVKEPTQNGTLY